MVDLPNNTDFLNLFNINFDENSTKDEPDYVSNGMCITVWLTGERYTWELGYCIERKDEGYIVEHLKRSKSGNDIEWKHPVKQDIQEVFPDQMLPCPVIGIWDTNNIRNMKFSIKNLPEIKKVFSSCL